MPAQAEKVIEKRVHSKWYSHEIKDKARALFVVGVNSTEIAGKLGIDRYLVNSWASRGKWALRKSEVVARSEELIADAQQRVVADAALAHQELMKKTINKVVGTLESFKISKASDFVPISASLKTLDDIGRRNVGLQVESTSQGNTKFDIHIGEKTNRKKVIEINPEKRIVDEMRAAEKSKTIDV